VKPASIDQNQESGFFGRLDNLLKLPLLSFSGSFNFADTSGTDARKPAENCSSPLLDPLKIVPRPHEIVLVNVLTFRLAD